MLKVGQIVKVRGKMIRILSIDSDVKCLVLGCALSNPDRSVWFSQNEIAA